MVTGGGGGGGGCFIATASFGSLEDPRVKILCSFRDSYLLQSSWGQIFVEKYYLFSPPLAEWISNSRMLRSLTGMLLIPLVGVSWLLIEFGLLGLLLSLGLLTLFTCLALKRVKSR